MNQAVQDSLNSGEVFSTEYVHGLREEAKANRLKAEKLVADATTVAEKMKKEMTGAGVEATRLAVEAAIGVERNNSKKTLDLEKIAQLLVAAGVKIDPVQIYQDGMEPDKAFDAYVEKNPDAFKKSVLKIKDIDIGAGESAQTLLSGTVKEVRNNPGSRSLFGKIYSKHLGIYLPFGSL